MMGLVMHVAAAAAAVGYFYQELIRKKI